MQDRQTSLPPGWRIRFGTASPLVELSIAAAVECFVAIVVELSRGGDLALAYSVFCVVTTVAAAGLVGVAVTLLGGATRAALALWMGLHAALFLSIAWGFFAGLATLAALWAARGASTLPGLAGLSAGVAIAFGFQLLPKIAYGDFDLGLAHPLWAVAGSCSALAVLLAVAQLRAPGPRRARELLLAAIAAATLLPIWEAARHPERRPPPPQIGSPTPSGPSVIVLILDTVRADHLSLYGYERKTTPRLDQFLARHPRAALYPLAFSNATWTLPSHATLFTGTLASEHGLHAQSMLRESGIVSATLRADSTLAERFHVRGYQTACVFANPWLEHGIGLARGFDWFHAPLGVGPLLTAGERLRQLAAPSWFVKEASRDADASAINRRVLAFLDGCGDRPCFVVANYMDAHAPYLPGRPYQDLFTRDVPAPSIPVQMGADRGPARLDDPPEVIERLEGLYDEDIRGLDAAIGDLLDELERSGSLERSWLVITADHGEAFAEHGAVEHGTTLHNEVTRIPLLILPPPGTPLSARSDAVSLIDLAATLSSIAGGPPLGAGRNLRDAAEPVARVQIELFQNPQRNEWRHGGRAGLPGRAVVRGSWKLIEHGETFELYDLAADPSELHELSQEHPEEVRELTGLLPELRAMVSEETSVPIPAEEQERLRELGYLL